MGSGGGNTTTSKQELSGRQKQILDYIIPTLEDVAKTGFQGYPGERVAGFTPNQQAGSASVVAAAGGPATDIAQSAGGASQFLTSGAVLDPSRNPGLAGAIQAGIDPIRQEFLTSVMPQVRSDAILAGQYGGSEQAESTNLASEAYLRQVGNATGNIVNQNYQAGLDALVRGLAVAPDTVATQYSPGAAIAGVGAQEQALQQQMLNAEMDKWLQTNYGDLLLAEQLAAIAFGMPLATGVTEQRGGGPGALLGGLGGAATGAALGSFFPGPGTAVGAGLGGLLGFLGS